MKCTVLSVTEIFKTPTCVNNIFLFLQAPTPILSKAGPREGQEASLQPGDTSSNFVALDTFILKLSEQERQRKPTAFEKEGRVRGCRGLEQLHLKNKEAKCRDLSAGPVVKSSLSNAGGEGSIPAWGATIPHVSHPKEKNNKNGKTEIILHQIQ